ncbi:MAG: hypothetical protein IJY99_00435 [Alphaproteobacteria bacterium]|nr:hypothetical protein [Alphaproteobacteria bacterium]
MKRFIYVFLLVFCTVPGVSLAQVATTAGNNLTAFNSNIGATNNNQWNQMMNPRAGGSGAANAPVADFGNCNSLILRCAQPKCSGCTTMDVARPIVAGCVNSNATCKKHGDALIDSIAAQMVSTAQAKAQQAQIQAQAAAAQAQAAESNAQMQQMQAQMQQMQAQMAEQNKQQMEQMQAALAEQKAMTEAALAEAATAKQESESSSSDSEDKSSDAEKGDSSMSSDGSVVGGLTAAQKKAIELGVDADIIARKQISGEILTKIEEAEVAMDKLHAAMKDAFDYAGCDIYGNNCAGPKRVKRFKEKALLFFRPYDEVVDNAYESLERALAVGVDVSDVIMMLSGACNRWAKYLCVGMDEEGENGTVTRNQAFYCDGRSTQGVCADGINCRNGKSIKSGYVRGGFECTHGMVVPPQDDVRCTPTEFIGGTGDEDKVLREWVNENDSDSGLVRVGCATSVLDTLAIFGRRTSRRDTGATLDLDTLERIIVQDAPEMGGTNRFMRNTGEDETVSRVKYCSMTPNGYEALRAAILNKKLPKNICVSNDVLTRTAILGGGISMAGYSKFLGASGVMPGVTKAGCDFLIKNSLAPDVCLVNYRDGACRYNEVECKLDLDDNNDVRRVLRMSDEDRKKQGCESGYSGGIWDNTAKKCDCQSDEKIVDPYTGECFHKGDISYNECKAMCSNAGAGTVAKVEEAGKKCLCDGEELFDVRNCDMRLCDDQGGRVRLKEEKFFKSREDFENDNELTGHDYSSHCCTCQSNSSTYVGDSKGKKKGKTVPVMQPFKPEQDKCNKDATNFKELVVHLGRSMSRGETNTALSSSLANTSPPDHIEGAVSTKKDTSEKTDEN